jgi:hypothetical protein
MSVLEHGREAALSCSIARMKKAKSGKRDSLMKGSKSLKECSPEKSYGEGKGRCERRVEEKERCERQDRAEEEEGF